MTSLSQRLGSHTNPLVCYVTDRRALPPPSRCTATHPLGWASQLLDTLTRAVEAGVDMVQLREKDLSGKALLDLAIRAREIVAGEETRRGAPEASGCCALLINDRLDVALAAGTSGVHLGSESVPVSEITRLRSPQVPRVPHRPGFVAPASRAGHSSFRDRKTQAGAGRRRYELDSKLGPELPSGFLVGRSCHSLDEALEAERSGADFLFFGPVFATPSKAQFGPPQGLDALSAVCRAVRIPVLAIGGITLESAQSCISVGAAGLAAIRLFQESSGMPAMIRALKGLK